jgi:hypothetical protein
MQHLEGSGTPVLYIGHTVLKRLILLNGRRVDILQMVRHVRVQDSNVQRKVTLSD